MVLKDALQTFKEGVIIHYTFIPKHSVIDFPQTIELQ